MSDHSNKLHKTVNNSVLFILSIQLHHFSLDNSVSVGVNRYHKILADHNSKLWYFKVSLYHGHRKISSSNSFQLHEKESVSRNSRATRFSLGDLAPAQVSLVLKVKRWTTFLRKDVAVCEIVFSSGSRGRPGSTGLAFLYTICWLLLIHLMAWQTAALVERHNRGFWCLRDLA